MGVLKLKTSRQAIKTPLKSLPDSRSWNWGPAILREMERWGIPWVSLERDISPKELGGSPGEIAWFRGRLLIEEDCPREWVVHEIAHYLVCKKHTPEFLNRQNWGLDDTYSPEDLSVLYGKLGIDARTVDWDSWCESEASFLNCALLIYLHLPWRSAAYQLNILDDVWPGEVYWGRSPPKNPRAWRIVRERILAHSRPYTDGTYS